MQKAETLLPARSWSRASDCSCPSSLRLLPATCWIVDSTKLLRAYRSDTHPCSRTLPYHAHTFSSFLSHQACPSALCRALSRLSSECSLDPSFSACVQYTTGPAAPNCDCLPESASFRPRRICPAEAVARTPPHLDGGRALYRDDCFQGAPTALVTASISDEAARNCEQCCSRWALLYRTYTRKSQCQPNSIDPVSLLDPRLPITAPPVRHSRHPGCARRSIRASPG